MDKKTALKILLNYEWRENGVKHWLSRITYLVREDDTEYFMCDVCDDKHPLGKPPQTIYGVDENENIFACTEDNTPLPYPTENNN